MCKEFGQTCIDEQDNFRVLLQIYHERSNQLANIIQASNGLIVTILVGVLAFAGTRGNPHSPLFIAFIVLICVISLLLWRAYAHYIDNDIVRMYGKILCCERKLNVPIRTSLLLSLIRGIPEKSDTRKELNDYLKSENFSRAYNEMFILIEAKKVGPRGHNWLDGFALLFTFVSIFVSIAFFLNIFLDIIGWIIGGIVIFIISVFLSVILIKMMYPILHNYEISHIVIDP